MPSAEQQAFWSAIRTNPDDDTPRLVYADWLQEHGDVDRAEFIRAQIGLARLEPDPQANAGNQVADLATFMRSIANLPPDSRKQALAERKQAIEHASNWFRERKLLLDREKDLFDRNWERWVEPFRIVPWKDAPADQVHVTFEREGHFDQETATSGRLPPNKVDCRLRANYTGWQDNLVVTFRRGFAAPFGFDLRWAYWFVLAEEQLEEPFVIEQIHGGVSEDDVQLNAVAAWPHAGNVTRLRLYSTRDSNIRAIIAAGRLTGLQRMRLDNSALTDDGAVELAASPMFSRLKWLGLEQNQISDGGAYALADSAHLSGLEHLAIRGNPIGVAGKQRLRDRFGDRVLLEYSPT